MLKCGFLYIFLRYKVVFYIDFVEELRYLNFARSRPKRSYSRRCHGAAAPRGVSAEQRRRYADYFGSSSIFMSFSLARVNERDCIWLVLSDHKKTEMNVLSLSLPVEYPRGTHRRTLYLAKSRLFSTTITGSTRQILSRHHSQSTRQISSDGHQNITPNCWLSFLQCTCTR